MDKAVSLAGIASMQMQISKNSEGIQLMLDLFETKSNSVIASWANKANRQGGTMEKKYLFFLLYKIVEMN